MTSFVTSLFVLLVVAIGWHVFERRWDRALFGTQADRIAKNLSAREAAALIRKNPDTQVLDVRMESECYAGTLPKAINVPLGHPSFREWVGELDRQKPLLVYCAGGFRSRKAVVILKELGFMQIYHMHRGWLSWHFIGLPLSRHLS